jgi:hypothetical protein
VDYITLVLSAQRATAVLWLIRAAPALEWVGAGMPSILQAKTRVK